MTVDLARVRHTEETSSTPVRKCSPPLSCLGRHRKSFATSPGYLRTVRATWSTRPRYLRRALAEEPAQPVETPAEVVDHEAASSSLPWHRPDPDDIPPARRGPS